MSIESAKAFLEKVRSNEDFRKSVGEIATAEERMKYVKEEGFDFTKEEINLLKDELGADDLDTVAGGVLNTCDDPVKEAYAQGCTGYDHYKLCYSEDISPP